MSDALRPGRSSEMLPAIAPGLRARLRDWRNRTIASARFRSFAAAFPLTRPVARRQTAALFDLAAGFVYSQILYAFVRLGLVEQLARGPISATDLAARTGLSAERSERLLRAAAALDLAERRDDRYVLGAMGAALVDNDGVLAMIEHHALLYEDLCDPVALLRGTTSPRLEAFWRYGGHVPTEATAYSRLMASSQSFIAREVLDALPLDGVRVMLDVGGGSGAFAIAAARRHGHLRCHVFDLPQVIELARENVSREGLGDRVAATGGSFLANPLPLGADMATLVRVLHDHDDDAALALLRATRAALQPGGRIAIAEPMAETPGAERAGDAYFGFYLLAMGSGRPRRPDEIAGMLGAAGFTKPRLLNTSTPLLARVMTASVV